MSACTCVYMQMLACVCVRLSVFMSVSLPVTDVDDAIMPCEAYIPTLSHVTRFAKPSFMHGTRTEI